MKRLVCFDLDGTLLRDDKTIPIENINAITKALDAGCYVSIVTGRSFTSAFQIAKEIGLYRKNCFLINFQGNAIFRLEDQEMIFESGLSGKDVKALLKDLNEKGLYAQTYDTNGIITNNDCTDLRLYNKIAVEPIRFVNDWDELEDKVYPKVISIDFSSSKALERYQKDYLKTKDAKRISCFFSDPKFLEFCDINISKGTAIKHLAEYLNLTLDDVIAVGDERNDISMIQMAHMGCAMANSHPEVKQYADYVTTNTNNQAGVAEVIYKFVLNQESRI